MCLSLYLPAYSCRTPFPFPPQPHVSHAAGTRCSEQSGWKTTSMSRSKLVKPKPVAHGVLLEGDIGQVWTFKWPSGEPLIWAPFSCVKGRQCLPAKPEEGGRWRLARARRRCSDHGRGTAKRDSGSWSRGVVCIGLCEWENSHKPLLYEEIKTALPCTACSPRGLGTRHSCSLPKCSHL